MRKVGVIFGGRSCENEISVLTGVFVARLLKESFEVFPIYLHTDGGLYSSDKMFDLQTFKKKEFTQFSRVFLDGGVLYAFKKGEKIKRLIGVSPQETAVAPNLSVKENLELLCGLYGFSKQKRQEKVMELTERFRLQEVFLKKAKTLSGGWQRRVSIAMALVGEPSVLFLDEPTLGLDVIARRELWEIIRSLKGKATIILTTHYLEEAEALADEIGVMKNGKLIAVGTARALMERTGADNFEEAFISIVREGQV